jgi:hypothetical protein
VFKSGLRAYGSSEGVEELGRVENWEFEHFDNMPPVGTLIILSKIENDVKDAESVVIHQELLYSMKSPL